MSKFTEFAFEELNFIISFLSVFVGFAPTFKLREATNFFDFSRKSGVFYIILCNFADIIGRRNSR